MLALFLKRHNGSVDFANYKIDIECIKDLFVAYELLTGNHVESNTTECKF